MRYLSRVLCAEDERRNDTMDIGEWLQGLGLEQYEQAFRENEIDLRILPELTADDLKELGVGAGTVVPRQPPPSPSPPGLVPGITGEGGLGAEAERRQLTVVFCDLVGSTPLSTRFDPRICARSSAPTIA